MASAQRNSMVGGKVGHNNQRTYNSIYMTDLLWEETKRFDSWQAAKEFLCTLKGQYVFRGMSYAEWNLETTLDRKLLSRLRERESTD